MMRPIARQSWPHNGRRDLPSIGFGVLLAGAVLAGMTLSTHAETDYEEQFIKTLRQIQDGKIDSSLQSLNGIVDQYPNSKLGHLVLADLLALRAGQSSMVDQFSDDRNQLQGLRDEIRYRWESSTFSSPALSGMVPSNLLSIPTRGYTLVADASRARLYVYQFTEGSYRLVDDYFMTIGKQGMGKTIEGDLKTPEGVYFVTSYIDGNTLPPRYGPGAFPIDYPNEIDLHKKRTGYGIWIHGTEPENYNRIPLASDGCLSLSNDAFDDLRQYITHDGTTPVIVSREIEWVDPVSLADNRLEILDMLNNWVEDWESLDPGRFLAHYSSSDHLYGKDEFKSWVERKQGTIETKLYIDVEFDNVAVFRYPGEKGMMLISFDQTYRSDSYNSSSRKKQYWRRDQQGNWKIIYEKAA